MAATGEPFWPSAKSVVGLLGRQGLNTFTAWWLPSFVLFVASAALTMLFGQACLLAVWLFAPHAGLDVTLSVLVSVVLVFVVLLFTANILKNIVDTVYVCYARDLENHTVSQPEIHAVYGDLPKPDGAVVVQPDAGVAYGAMEEGRGGGASPTAAQRLLDEQ